MKEATYLSIKEARKALRMSSKQLAKKVKKAPSTLSELENREATGNITLLSLQEIAMHLGCDFKYEFIPKKPIADTLLHQAIKQIKSELGDAHHQYTDDEIKTDALHLLKESKYLNW